MTKDGRMKVTVTGGLGFIGSHVVDGLLAAGHDVQIIDSMVAAVTDGREYESHPRSRVHRMAVRDFLEDRGFDGAHWVIHAASPVGPVGILADQGRLGGEIVATAQAVADACLESGSALCTFSSAEVYGRSGLLAEGDAIRVPVAYNARIEYAIAKTLTEALTINNRHRGLRATVIRPFNVAGSRQSRTGGFVMPTFVQQALAGEPLTVFAGGTQIRAFLAASDLARFVVDHLDAALDSGEPIFNLGNADNAVSVWSLAERVVALLGSSSPIEHRDGREVHGPLYEEAESLEKVPVLRAAPSVGWRPRVTLDELILQTADFYRTHEDLRAESELRARV
jgi:nucleoside-diphosphate-sugar epimerase